jgi:hypothetical protein
VNEDKHKYVVKTTNRHQKHRGNTMGEAPSQRKPKIAVIAVHGVADQSPHDSARAIANLLLNPKQTDKQIQYTPFEESTLRNWGSSSDCVSKST